MLAWLLLSALADGAGSAEYRKLLSDHLEFIERRCRWALGNARREPPASPRGNPEVAPGALRLQSHDEAMQGDPDELFVRVVDRLAEDDFRILREFRGQAKLTTYITTIIANLVVDLAREKSGRSRAKERAREMGATGEALYEYVFARGYSVAEAREQLHAAHGVETTVAGLQEMLDRMQGRSRLAPAAEGVVAFDGETPVLVDCQADPSEALSRREREKAHGTLASVLESLTDAERAVLRLRFPDDESRPACTLAEIGRCLGISEKAADRKVRAILAKCREALLAQGLRREDVIEG